MITECKLLKIALKYYVFGNAFGGGNCPQKVGLKSLIAFFKVLWGLSWVEDHQMYIEQRHISVHFGMEFGCIEGWSSTHGPLLLFLLMTFLWMF